ncbi:hypothetical protein V2A60_004747 [Cordyceps javanica]
MSEQARLTVLTAQIAQMHQEMEYWRHHEQNVIAQLNAAMRNLQQYTRHGQFPDPIVSAAVNNHSIALNQIRQNMARLQARKSAAEGEYNQLLRRVGPFQGQ